MRCEEQLEFEQILGAPAPWVNHAFLINPF